MVLAAPHPPTLATDIEINGTEQSPEISPFTYGQLIFDKGGKNIKSEKVSSESSAEEVGQLHVNQ